MTQLRTASVNVQTLENRASEVISLFDTRDLDLFCLQETRVTTDSLPAYERAFAKADLQFWNSPTTWDSKRRPTGGVGWVCRWPAARAQLPPGLDPRRFLGDPGAQTGQPTSLGDWSLLVRF